jgi:hypothetical protein
MIFMPSFTKIPEMFEKLLGGTGPRTSHYKTEISVELPGRKLKGFSRIFGPRSLQLQQNLQSLLPKSLHIQQMLQILSVVTHAFLLPALKV